MVGEWPFLLARFDDASGQSFAYAGELRKLRPSGRIDINLKSRRLCRQMLEFHQATAQASLRTPPQSHRDKRNADEPCDRCLISTPQ
jgi:hypothetical protein